MKKIDAFEILEVAEEVIKEMKRKLKEAKDLEEGRLYRCSCCDLMKETPENQVWRNWTRGNSVAICQECDLKIEKSKFKTVLGFLNNQ